MNRTVPNENDITFYVVVGSGTAVLIAKLLLTPQLLYDIFILFLFALMLIKRYISRAPKHEELSEESQSEALYKEEFYDNLIQIEKFKSLSFVISAFAHEINNPLTGILGTADILQNSEIPRESLVKRAGFIKKQALRISSIIDELNHLQPEMVQSKLEMDLNNLLEKLQKILMIHYRKYLDIVFVPAKEPLILVGNHYSLWHVFESILKNSVETGTKELRIEISSRREENSAVVTIRDNGQGFEDMNKAFDPFYTTKDRTLHKGIGLSIAYANVQEHGGTISLANNHGAELTITLPLADKSSSAENTNTGGEE